VVGDVDPWVSGADGSLGGLPDEPRLVLAAVVGRAVEGGELHAPRSKELVTVDPDRHAVGAGAEIIHPQHAPAHRDARLRRPVRLPVVGGEPDEGSQRLARLHSLPQPHVEAARAEVVYDRRHVRPMARTHLAYSHRNRRLYPSRLTPLLRHVE